MKTYSFYDAQTGLFVGKTFSSNDEQHDTRRDPVKAHTPEGLQSNRRYSRSLVKEGRSATGEVVDYQPVQPSPEHEWNSDTKRWVVSAAAADRTRKRTAALARIAALEAAQHRPLRELALNPQNADARKGLETIDSEIGGLRVSVTGSDSYERS